MGRNIDFSYSSAKNGGIDFIHISQDADEENGFMIA